MAMPMAYRRPSHLLLGLEAARATWELGWFAAWIPTTLLARHGDGHTVITLPGFMGADAATAALRGVLHRLGYDARGWELGSNIGPTRPVSDGLDALLERGFARGGRPVSLVGVSLGGVFAREMARRHPGHVRQVITLGSPFRLPQQGDERPLPVPSTAIYTRTDGIVPWESCIDVPGPESENVEVPGSHFGLAHNPFALHVVVDRLGQPEGSWTPYRGWQQS